MMEQTLSIIKPNAVTKNRIGEIVARFESEGIRIAAMKMMVLSHEKAHAFYVEHKGKPFFGSLVQFMTSGPVVVMVLEGEEVIQKNRKIMGHTDPAKAEPNTLRKLYADSIDHNAVHGSDSAQSADREIAFFFDRQEIAGRF